MAESLKDLVAKLKAQQQNSQTSNNPAKPMDDFVKKETKLTDEDEDDEELEEDFEQEEETPKVQKQETKETPKKVDDAEIKQIQDTISSLHDNGVFRLELLNNLQQINNNMRVIAGVLLEISGYGKQTK